jgi:hypothetical protein
MALEKYKVTDIEGLANLAIGGTPEQNYQSLIKDPQINTLINEKKLYVGKPEVYFGRGFDSQNKEKHNPLNIVKLIEELSTLEKEMGNTPIAAKSLFFADANIRGYEMLMVLQKEGNKLNISFCQSMYPSEAFRNMMMINGGAAPEILKTLLNSTEPTKAFDRIIDQLGLFLRQVNVYSKYMEDTNAAKTTITMHITALKEKYKDGFQVTANANTQRIPMKATHNSSEIIVNACTVGLLNNMYDLAQGLSEGKITNGKELNRYLHQTYTQESFKLDPVIERANSAIEEHKYDMNTWPGVEARIETKRSLFIASAPIVPAPIVPATSPLPKPSPAPSHQEKVMNSRGNSLFDSIQRAAEQGL